LIERKVSGLRKSPHNLLTKQDIKLLEADIIAIGADLTVFKFNNGTHTGYADDSDEISVRGDVFPDDVYSIHPRDMMSARAVLAHEYYGHRMNRGTSLKKGAWNDEFRASYMAARTSPGLSEKDRMLLVMDAMERAKEAGVTIRWNNFMKGVVHGSDYNQNESKTD